MKVVIMAGGKGTRIASINADVPKPMIRICGKPILEWQIKCLKRQGYVEFILIVGHLGNIITEYFRDGQKFGVSIQYIVETEPLGTAGALFLLKNKIAGDFLLLNGDIIFDINVDRFYQYHKQYGGIATLFTHPNDHPYDSGIIIANAGHCVTDWLHKEDERLWYKNRVNAGIHMFTPAIFEKFHELKKLDLDRDIIKPMIPDHTLYVYDSPEYVKDMGTPDRFYAVEEDIKKGKVFSKNLSNKQKAVFLDRDGTINKYVGFLRNIDDFELLPGAVEMIKKINKIGYLAIVVTNQPVIARGEVSWDELNEIHNKMETLLGQQGAYLDEIFVCPHHPDKGFPGERPEYKMECECRKPKPGMLLKAAELYNIDLEQSYMVGDSDVDMIAGKAAGCKTYKVGEE
ncbi:MAG: HAD-IIIA family hydrolase [Candidatus Fimivivens sp.]|nr:HAD-IIIA family hydrolase [Candidatus Fimivivens sp.]